MGYYFEKASKISKTEFINSIKKFAETNKTQIYLLTAPLLINNDYNFTGGYIVLMPKHKVMIFSQNGRSDQFDNYYEDVIEDISALSINFEYVNRIGRKRDWKYLYEQLEEPQDNDFSDFIKNHTVENSDFRKIDFFISLFIGSINSANNIVLEEPQDLLDKVKSKILLFDADQTRFIYNDIQSKRVVIQGLAGTGKTELLLHKMKGEYLADDTSKICFTCHNKVLADSLRSRIPSFFDYMKVSKQIAWNERLFCFSAWGSYSYKYSGTLRYICDFYNVPFYNLKEVGSNFSNACKNVLKSIKELGDIGSNYAFTYTFIDESQDFDDPFFELCEYVTEKKMFLAGDVFQNIFTSKDLENIKADFVLNKCYRTDPKTFMFAQGLGLGYLEDKPLWWYSKNDLTTLGYNVKEFENKYELSREPLKRFEDIPSDYDSFVIKEDHTSDFSFIINEITKLKENHSKIEAHDICIIFLESDDYEKYCKISFELGINILEKTGWMYNLAHESKQKQENAVFITNKNNVKGLEFPFVFCITKKIEKSRSYRNTIYTMLSRSFLKSYLIILDSDSNGFDEQMRHAAELIKKEGILRVSIPSIEDQEKIKSQISEGKKVLSLDEIARSIIESKKISPKDTERIITSVRALCDNEKDLDENKIHSIIDSMISYLSKN